MMTERRHTLAPDHLDGAWCGLVSKHNTGIDLRDGPTWRNDLARENLNIEPPVVQMLDVDGASGKSCDKIDLGVVEEIIVLPLESGVGLLLNLEDDVAG